MWNIKGNGQIMYTQLRTYFFQLRRKQYGMFLDEVLWIFERTSFNYVRCLYVLLLFMFYFQTLFCQIQFNMSSAVSSKRKNKHIEDAPKAKKNCLMVSRSGCTGSRYIDWSRRWFHHSVIELAVKLSTTTVCTVKTRPEWMWPFEKIDHAYQPIGSC